MPTKPKPPAKPAPPESTPEQEQELAAKLVSKQTIEAWIKAKKVQEDAVAAERLQRAAIATALGVEGKSKTTTVHGYKIEVINGTDYGVNKGVTETIFDQVVEVLTAEAPDWTDNEIAREADRVIDNVLKYTPELKLKGYKELNDALREVFDDYITTKPSSVQVKVTKVE